MPIIQDPRQNPGQEKDHGIVWMPDPFEIDEVIHSRGHYFYDRTGQSRFFPHGFPVKLHNNPISNSNVDGPTIEYYQKIFPNLMTHIVLNVVTDQEELDRGNYPMAQFIEDIVRRPVLTNQTVTGLGNINFGRPYSYKAGVGNNLGRIDED